MRDMKKNGEMKRRAHRTEGLIEGKKSSFEEVKEEPEEVGEVETGGERLKGSVVVTSREVTRRGRMEIFVIDDYSDDAGGNAKTEIGCDLEKDMKENSTGKGHDVEGAGLMKGNGGSERADNVEKDKEQWNTGGKFRKHDGEQVKTLPNRWKWATEEGMDNKERKKSSVAREE